MFSFGASPLSSTLLNSFLSFFFLIAFFRSHIIDKYTKIWAHKNKVDISDINIDFSYILEDIKKPYNFDTYLIDSETTLEEIYDRYMGVEAINKFMKRNPDKLSKNEISEKTSQKKIEGDNKMKDKYKLFIDKMFD